MQTSEVLNTAADLIEERGWKTGDWGTQEVGAPLCLEGGILAALGFGWEQLNTDIEWDEWMACPARLAVHSYLDLPKVRGELWRWNDAFDEKTGGNLRTAAEVVEVLRATAVIEAAREQETAEASA